MPPRLSLLHAQGDSGGWVVPIPLLLDAVQNHIVATNVSKHLTKRIRLNKVILLKRFGKIIFEPCV